MPDFSGKTIVITGGGSGLGRAMAEHLASLGGSVVVTGRRPEPLAQTVEAISNAGGEAEATPADVRAPDQVETLIAGVVERHGGVDCLINNAAGNFIVRAEELSPNGWNAVINIVLNGTFYCSRAAGRAMIARARGGSILNMVASYAWTGGPGTIHSAAAKAGVIAMTQTLAVEWGRYGIRTNALCPGVVNTPGAAEKLFPTEAIRERIARRVPLGRLESEGEVARAAAFLLSDEASYVNGAVFVADGGMWLEPGLLATVGKVER
ncbi:MAG: 2,4-dienoyl-CoA reductase [Candidatus Eremiobacteraeota bacterium]|nr:2,4-dienoyl-CoA reductase [Candidatus Eremiobacteraeota bacterium]MBV8366324.1 2,4-dienoyl-CoA reductase [Candidatus Eremiobacteraeota bacterium]